MKFVISVTGIDQFDHSRVTHEMSALPEGGVKPEDYVALYQKRFEQKLFPHYSLYLIDNDTKMVSLLSTATSPQKQRKEYNTAAKVLRQSAQKKKAIDTDFFLSVNNVVQDTNGPPSDLTFVNQLEDF